MAYHQIKQDHTVLFDEKYWQNFSVTNQLFVFLHLTVMFLSFVNWGVEAFKWKMIVEEIQPVKFSVAYKGVLCGLGVSMFSPRFFGESVGRMFYLTSTNRERAIAGLLISRMGQLSVTLILGSIALFYYSGFLSNKTSYIWVSMSFILLIIAFLMLRGRIIVRLSKWFNPKVMNYLALLKETKNTLLGKVFLLSFLRYTIFLGQFLLIFKALDVNLILIDLTVGIAVFFLLRSIIVSVNILLDFAIRLSAAIIVFGGMVTAFESVLLVVSIIWLINVLIPSLVGVFFIYGIKLKPTEHR